MKEIKERRKKIAGNTFFTALVFVFVLVGTLRLCCNKTLHETKLTGIFIQETQGYYLLENLMALARDYAYQLTQNPREPNLFLSASAYREKDRTYQKSQGEENAWVIDFNGSLKKNQIVPDDFPLQIAGDNDANKGWDIKGGPIFWQDKKKDSNDERWLSEVFMLGSLSFSSGLIPNWTMHMVQTMEIERNPLCDFQLYAEGETSFTGNITCKNSDWYINFYGPIQINANARFPYYMGYGSSGSYTHIYVYNKFNIAGNALEFRSTYKSIKTPIKYHMQDNSDFYDGFTNPYTTESTSNHINCHAVNHDSTYFYTLSTRGASNSYTHQASYKTFERYAFESWYQIFSTKSRIYRPCGFDPLSYWGWWKPYAYSTYKPQEGTDVDKDYLLVDLCLGMHNLVKSSSYQTHYLYSKKFANYNPFTSINSLRGLTDYQIAEKVRLVESQKIINGPALTCKINLRSANDMASLCTVNDILYPTYDYETYFPAKYDNFYLNHYLQLKTKNSSIISSISFFKHLPSSSFNYKFGAQNDPSSDSPNIEESQIYTCINNNKLAYDSISKTVITGLENIFSSKKALTPQNYSDVSCPPYKIIDYSTYWKIGSNQTRIKTDETYQFIYDRNRSKWVQIIDFDVKALKDAIDDSTIPSSDWDAMNHTVKFDIDWQGGISNANRNYKMNANDIRHNYISNRTNFFNTYTSSLSYTNVDNNHVIDIGVRIINAEELPTGGLTIFCPYPVYLQSSFNTTNTTPKAVIITDSLTILSDSTNNASKYWTDWTSQMDFKNSRLIHPDGNTGGRNPPTIYAHIITGRTHPHYWLTANKNVLNPDLGFHDAIRTLEDFTSPIKFYGSLLLPFYAQEQWEPPINFCHYSRTPKSYAFINWYLGDGSQWKSMRTAPGMPFYYRINHGRKTQAIGEATYNTLIGNTLYTKDWNSGSFSTYHTNLPNYLKYETAP